jgi:hypothetical protein
MTMRTLSRYFSWGLFDIDQVSCGGEPLAVVFGGHEHAPFAIGSTVSAVGQLPRATIESVNVGGFTVRAYGWICVEIAI